jgi:hypothetical protein
MACLYNTMSDLCYIEAATIFPKETVLRIVKETYDANTSELMTSNYDVLKNNVRLYNTAFVHLPGGWFGRSKCVIISRVTVSTSSNMRPGCDPHMANKLPGLVGIDYWWTRQSAGGSDSILYTESNGKYEYVSKLNGEDLRLFLYNGEVYYHDRYFTRMYRVNIANGTVLQVYELNKHPRGFPYGSLDMGDNSTNTQMIKVDFDKEQLSYFPGFYPDAAIIVHRYGKSHNLESLNNRKKELEKRIETILEQQKELRNRRNDADRPLYKQLNDERISLGDIIRNEIEFRLEGRKREDMFVSSDGGYFTVIKYDTGYSISFEGSYDTGKEQHRIKYGINYGISPCFSLSTPLVEANHPAYGAVRLGIGHSKIQSSLTKPYLSGRLNSFRNNLYSDLESLYPGRYAIHGKAVGDTFVQQGHNPNAGFIYLMYFYFITTDNRIFLSDSYLPFNNENKYKFALCFPTGLQVIGDKVVVSGGEGDYYTFFARWDLADALGRCRHNAQRCDMREYLYYIELFGEDGSHRLVERLTAQ